MEEPGDVKGGKFYFPSGVGVQGEEWSVCVCVYTYRCIIDADYSTGRTPYSLEIESSRKTNILCCMLISHN